MRKEIMVTSYEESKGKWNPVLSHIFYGDTIEQALGYAKSHLKTDYFFSSSFLGRMKWKEGEVLILDNEVTIYSSTQEMKKSEIEQALEKEAARIHKQQDRNGMLLVIQSLV